MKACVISDTHSCWERLKIPKCDIFIHAGDIGIHDEKDMFNFINWMNNIPSKHNILVAGNHDKLIAEKEELFRHTCNSGSTKNHYLNNECVIINDILFYGSPITPEFNNWWFMKNRGKEIKKEWNKIPKNTHVLITHGPRYGVMDASNATLFNSIGCEELGKKIDEIKPKYHIFGHLHGGYGKKVKKGTRYYNVSVVDEAYQVVNKPTIINLV